MDHTGEAYGFLATLILVDGIVILLVIAFTIWVFWRIFEKAGYNGAMALLNLIPGVGHLICLIILAFGRWPIEDRLAAAFGTTYGAPPPPPGTSVMPTS
jgi:uncharacterized membrane protein YhaH (DUF805 family)